MPSLPTWLLAAGLVAPAEPVALSEGNAAAECQWPTVVSFRAGEDKCTGLLVHPEVIVTAAHCIAEAPAGRVRFGERFQPAAERIYADHCGIHPEFAATGAPSSDLGYCVLSEPMLGIPPTPLLMGCETAWIEAGLPAVLVGFGTTADDDLFGTKRYAFTVLDSELRSDGTVWVGDAEVNGCQGDSGGPAFVRSPAGTWHALGLLTFGPECGQGPVLYRALFDRIAWLEDETGRDLSPCHDADGAWAPGPECEPIAADPLATGRTWDDACASEEVEAPRCPEPEPEPEPASTDDGDASSDDAAASAAADAPAEGGCACRATPTGEPGRLAALLLLLLGLSRSARRRAWC